MRAAIARIAAVLGAGRISVSRPCRDAARHFRRFSSLPHARHVLLPAQGADSALRRRQRYRSSSTAATPRRGAACRVDDGVGRYDPPGERARRGAGGGGKGCGISETAAHERLGSLRPRSIFCATSASAKRSTMSAADRRKPKAIRTCCWSKRCCWRTAAQLAAAEDACQRLLPIDELNAGAHYVLALCREHAGRARARHGARSGRRASRSRLSPCRGCIAACWRAMPATATAPPRTRAGAASAQARGRVAAAAVRRRLYPRRLDRAVPIGRRGMRGTAMTDALSRLARTGRGAARRLRSRVSRRRCAPRPRPNTIFSPFASAPNRAPCACPKSPACSPTARSRACRAAMPRCSALPVFAARSCRSTACATLLGHSGTQAPRWLVIAAAAPVALAFDAFEGHLRASADAILPQQSHDACAATPASSSAPRMWFDPSCICLPSSRRSARRNGPTLQQ